MSKQNDAIVWAYDKGYRVQEDGSVSGINVDTMSLYCSDTNYLRFNVKPPWSKHKVHVKVHRLAGYQKFGKFWDEDLEVDHIDGNTQNNKLSNINVVTHANNIRKSHSPLTWDDVNRIRDIASSSNRRGLQADIAREYNVSPSCIHGIVSGRNW